MGKQSMQRQSKGSYVPSNAETVAATTNGGANKWAIGNYGFSSLAISTLTVTNDNGWAFSNHHVL